MSHYPIATVVVGGADPRNGRDRPIYSFNVPPALAEAAQLCTQIRILERRYRDEQEELELARETATRRMLADLRGSGIELADHELERLVVESVGVRKHRAPSRTARDLRVAVARLFEIAADAGNAVANPPQRAGAEPRVGGRRRAAASRRRAQLGRSPRGAANPRAAPLVATRRSSRHPAPATAWFGGGSVSPGAALRWVRSWFVSRIAAPDVGFTLAAEQGIAQSAAALGITTEEVKEVVRAGLTAAPVRTKITVSLTPPVAGFIGVRLDRRWTDKNLAVVSVQRADGRTLTIRARGPERQPRLLGGRRRLREVSDVEWWCSRGWERDCPSWAPQ